MVCESMVVEISLGLACWIRAGMRVSLVGATFSGARSHMMDGRQVTNLGKSWHSFLFFGRKLSMLILETRLAKPKSKGFLPIIAMGLPNWVIICQEMV